MNCDKRCHVCYKDCDMDIDEVRSTLDCKNRMACFLADTEDCTIKCPGYDTETSK